MMVSGFSISALLWMSCSSISAKPGLAGILLSVHQKKQKPETLQSRNIYLIPASRFNFPWLPVISKDVHNVCVLITNWQVHKLLWSSVVFLEVTVILCTLHNTLDVRHTPAAMNTNDKTSGLPWLWYGLRETMFCVRYMLRPKKLFIIGTVCSLKYKLRLKNNITSCR